MCNCGSIAVYKTVKKIEPLRVIRPISSIVNKNQAKNEVDKHRA